MSGTMSDRACHPVTPQKRVATNLTTLPIGDTPIPKNGTRPLYKFRKIEDITFWAMSSEKIRCQSLIHT